MGKKTVKQAIRASAGKVPKAEFNPDSYYDQTPVWSFCFCDFEHEKWGSAVIAIDSKVYLSAFVRLSDKHGVK